MACIPDIGLVTCMTACIAWCLAGKCWIEMFQHQLFNGDNLACVTRVRELMQLKERCVLKCTHTHTSQLGNLCQQHFKHGQVGLGHFCLSWNSPTAAGHRKSPQRPWEATRSQVHRRHHHCLPVGECPANRDCRQSVGVWYLYQKDMGLCDWTTRSADTFLQ